MRPRRAIRRCQRKALVYTGHGAWPPRWEPIVFLSLAFLLAITSRQLQSLHVESLTVFWHHRLHNFALFISLHSFDVTGVLLLPVCILWLSAWWLMCSLLSNPCTLHCFFVPTVAELCLAAGTNPALLTLLPCSPSCPAQHPALLAWLQAWPPWTCPLLRTQLSTTPAR